MLSRYVLLDLVRNPRRTLSTMVGVMLGVGLFCGVLFFVDGLSSTMTQRALAPLPIDMQRIVADPIGATMKFTQAVDPVEGSEKKARVLLYIENVGDVVANEVTVRSAPVPGVAFDVGSARIDGSPMEGFDDNPFATGLAQTGYNLGSLDPGESHTLSYVVTTADSGAPGDESFRSTFSSREAIGRIPANAPAPLGLAELADLLGQLDGVARASQLSLADLGSGKIGADGTVAPGPSKIFGFDAGYADNDPTIEIIDGELSDSGGVVSAEAAAAVGLAIGDEVTIDLPDSTAMPVVVTGIADLSQARSLFSSRRGGDLETFIYSRNSIIVSPGTFADTVFPAFERAATARGERLKNPPLREIDITLDRSRLNAEPASAVTQTRRVADDVNAVAPGDDFLIDNITNTLTVAAADARVAKRLFVFLGVPGALLAAVLAAYAGSVLAEAQRREQATLRIRGAGRVHLLRMLLLRTGLLTATGSVVGLGLGYFAAAAILGNDALQRADTATLATSALIGTASGFTATGSALYVTGRRSIDREINEDRARHVTRPPLWRRARLDIVGVVIVAAGTVLALRARAFDGAPGSVYFGRAAKLRLSLLVLPIAVWFAGSLLLARGLSDALTRARRRSSAPIRRPLSSLYRLSIGRRPWSIGNGSIVVALIVGLAVCLAAFTSSYDSAKSVDARFANGSDLRIAPGPASTRTYHVGDSGEFRTPAIDAVSPVIYGVRNVILKSVRTSDPLNLAAIDPVSFPAVAPVRDDDFLSHSADEAFEVLRTDPEAVMLSSDAAGFLRADIGDSLDIVLARATDAQVNATFRVAGIFERAPGFPDGADALMSIEQHVAHVPTKSPDFFLASTTGLDEAALDAAVRSIEQGPGLDQAFQIDTRESALARDQSSLAALNVSGLVDLDSTFALSMAAVTIAIFVFGLLLQRRREYVILRAQGLDAAAVRGLISAEAATLAVGGAIAGTIVGALMGYYFVIVLRPLFVLSPVYSLPVAGVAYPVSLVFAATAVASLAGSRMVNRLEPTELLRDE